MEAENQKTDTEVMFPDQTIYGENVRPWTYPRFVAVLPHFIVMTRMLKESGVTLDDIPAGESDLDFNKIMSLLEKVLPNIPVCEIVSKSIGVDREKVEFWEFDKTVAIFLTVMIQNARRIKNFSGLGKSVIETMKKTV